MSNDLKNKKAPGTPQTGRLFSENTTCGDYSRIKQSYSTVNREIHNTIVGMFRRFCGINSDYYRIKF